MIYTAANVNGEAMLHRLFGHVLWRGSTKRRRSAVAYVLPFDAINRSRVLLYIRNNTINAQYLRTYAMGIGMGLGHHILATDITHVSFCVYSQYKYLYIYVKKLTFYVFSTFIVFV